MPSARTLACLLPSVAVAAAAYQMQASPEPPALAPEAGFALAVDSPQPPRLAQAPDAPGRDASAAAGQDGAPSLAPVTQPSAGPGSQANASRANGSQANASTQPQALASVAAGRARYEPARGAYLGAAVDAASANGDPQVLAGLMKAWDLESGRHHALQLGFVQFPSPEGIFPAFDSDPRGWLAPQTFCEAADKNEATPILTLEPMLRPGQFARGWKAGAPAFEAAKVFAQGVGAWKKPIFIRWAHEMNGSWYPWAEWNDKNSNMQRDEGEDTGFPAADYRAAYRNVALMFRRYAPNAALVWCPNSGLLGGSRRDVFGPFYPGDDVVDWVGLDVYERGWTGPQPGSHLWGGQFANNLTHDMADDDKTTANESIDFYKTYAQGKRKPLMLAETSATLSYRTDLDADSRATLNNEWKSAYWNPAEYGWMQAVYGTSTWEKAQSQKLLQPIDARFPGLKAVVWFQIAKQEWIPVERKRAGRVTYQWFNDTYTDYRIGGGVAKDGQPAYASEELDLYRDLTSSPYFLQQLQK